MLVYLRVEVSRFPYQILFRINLIDDHKSEGLIDLDQVAQDLGRNYI